MSKMVFGTIPFVQQPPQPMYPGMPFMQMGHPMQGYASGFFAPQGQMGGGAPYGGMSYSPQQQPLPMHMMPQMPFHQQAAHMTPMMMQQAAANGLMMTYPHSPNGSHMPPYGFDQNVNHMPTMSPTEHAH